MKRFIFFLSVILSAQQAIDSPPLAHVLDSAGLLTPIHGLAGNFLSGPPGPELLAYSNDGDIEWRLEPGRLSATRNGRATVFPTAATRASFRGDVATLPESNESLRLTGDSLESAKPQTPKFAGRWIEWRDGKLQILQSDGAFEEIACPQEPESMTAAAANWAHLVINSRPHLLRLTPGRVALFVLPERRRE